MLFLRVYHDNSVAVLAMVFFRFLGIFNDVFSVTAFALQSNDGNSFVFHDPVSPVLPKVVMAFGLVKA